ncbi:MAG TPA: hypothetical protein VKM56_12025 [Verrucomicrobiae bacterium]|nr:hypothetical protein [Verrucomicrobiae bacterium]
MPIIVLSPFNVVNFPQGGGHFWVYMQYAQGLLRLGCEVYWLENFRTSGDEQVDAALLHTFFARMHRYGLDGKVILYESGHSGGDAAPLEYIGMSPAEAEAVFDKADLLLNFHYAADASVLARFKRTALVDIDPGLLQFWISRSQLTVGAHDYYFTTGETVGTPGAFFPDCDLNWLRIRPPVCLEQWPYAYNSDAGTFTTISNWDSDDWIVDGDEAYENTKRRAFLEFIDLPRLTAQRLELALYLRTDRDFEDRAALEESGWRVRPSAEVAHTPESYQNYIQQSRGEFSCAKRSCMKFQNAWISDRTLCYLASGKPAVVQDTGPSSILPNGEGLFRFSTLKQAAKALGAVNNDYKRHSEAARQIVETYFDAKKVTEQILSSVL